MLIIVNFFFLGMDLRASDMKMSATILDRDPFMIIIRTTIKMPVSVAMPMVKYMIENKKDMSRMMSKYY